MDTKKLRQKILDLAIHGKLVPQDPNDEPASVLLERIRAEKEQLIKEGKIKAPKKGRSAGDTSHYPKEGPWDLPEGWVWCHLSDLARFAGGKTPSMDNKDFWENGKHLWITSKDMKSQSLKDSQMKISDRAVQEMTVFHPGSILMVNRSGILRRKLPLAILKAEATINQDIKAIVPYLSCLSPYLFYAILSQESFILSEYKKAGTTVDNINFDKFISLMIPLPPEKEQRRIVDAIAQYDSLLRMIDSCQVDLSTKVNDAKSKVLNLAIHGKLVPHDPTDEPAIEMLRRINPAFQPSHNLHYGEALPNGWFCTTYGALNQHKNKAENPMLFPKQTYELYSVPIYETGIPEYLTGKEIGSTKQLVSKGDILLCKINPHLNRVWVVDHHRPELKCISSSEWLIFKSEALLPEFARVFFMSPAFRELMLSNVSGVGGSLMRARGSAIDTYPIWVPPIKEQARIVKAVNAYCNVLDDIAAGIN